VLELRLPPKPTTTPIPYIHTTPKPRRTKQQHQGKNSHNHDQKNSKDVFIPNLVRDPEVNQQAEGNSLIPF
jgi:hypothetical protein